MRQGVWGGGQDGQSAGEARGVGKRAGGQVVWDGMESTDGMLKAAPRCHLVRFTVGGVLLLP